MTKEEQDLLEKGVTDYVDAVNAIAAFRKLVQKICRRVVESNLEEYATALGIELTKSDIREYDWVDADRSEFALGVSCENDEFVWVQLGHDFEWWRDDIEWHRGVFMWVDAKNKSIRKLREALRKKRAVFEDNEEWNLCVYQKIGADDVREIEKHLGELMKQWIEVWHKAGGLKVLE